MIRPAAVADADGIAAIHVANWEAAYRGILADEVLDGLDPEARRADWHDHLAEGATAIVAEEDGVIVGFVNFGPTRSRDRIGWGEVYALYVTPGRWRGGLGRALLDAAVDALRRAGFADVLLLTFAENRRARAFYEHCGWVADGTMWESPWGPSEARYVAPSPADEARVSSQR